MRLAGLSSMACASQGDCARPGHMNNIRRRWQTCLRLAVSVGVIAILLYQVDLHVATATVARIPPLHALLAMAAATISAFSAALAWKLLMDAQGLRLPLVRLQILYALGTFFAVFTPGGIGSDVIRTMRLQQWTNRGMEAGISILMSRILSVLVLVLVVVVASLSQPGLPIMVTALIALLMLLVGMVALFVAESPLMWVAHRWPSAPGVSLAPRAAGALRILRQQPMLVVYIVPLFVANHILGILPLYLAAHGLGMNLSFVDVMAAGLLLRIADFLPVSVAGVGVHEAGLVMLFGPLGLSPSDAIALSIVERLALLSVPLIGAIAYLSGWGGGHRRGEAMSAHRAGCGLDALTSH